MREDFLAELLLIEAPAVFRLYEQLNDIATYFVPPLFMLAILIEFFTDMDFFTILKKLLFVVLFINFFYHIHTLGADLSLRVAGQTLEQVSPNNLFLRSWYEPRVHTNTDESWGWFRSFAVPNLNDLIGTTLYVVSQIFLWLLKLIYSTVYHLTYVFSGITAILFFLGWTKDALKGTVQASIWCMVFPFVVIAILALVGSSISDDAMRGELVAGDINQLIWLFGITLLLLASPMMAYGMVKGDGIHSFGGKIGKVGMMGMSNLGLSMTVLNKSYGGAKKYYERAKEHIESKRKIPFYGMHRNLAQKRRRPMK